MIESRLDASDDDTGGGYGRYAGLTVAQTAERFRFLVEEGEGRSARAILRIAREQIEARGTLVAQRWVVAFFACATASLASARWFVAPETQGQVTFYAEIAGGLTLLFTIGAATIHRTTRRSEAQVREIRRLALTALDALIERDGFTPKPLDREHAACFNDLRRSDPATWQRVEKRLLTTHE